MSKSKDQMPDIEFDFGYFDAIFMHHMMYILDESPIRFLEKWQRRGWSVNPLEYMIKRINEGLVFSIHYSDYYPPFDKNKLPFVASEYIKRLWRESTFSEKKLVLNYLER